MHRLSGRSLVIGAVLVVAVAAAAGSALGRTASPLAGAKSATLATAVVSGAEGSCALTNTGGVRCWGYNGEDQLGTGQEGLVASSVPVDVSGLKMGLVALAAGDRHSCALTSTGGVKCWGMARSGQLGDGTAQRRLAPVDVVGLTSGAKAVAGGVNSSCALTSGGGVKCWGSNSSGNLGDGTSVNSSAPVDVVGLSSGVTAVTANCALTSAGGVKCWGYPYGLTPVDVFAPGSGIVAVTHACALTSAGGVKCWGFNDRGQIGDGTTVNRPTPVDVVGLTSGVTAVSAWGGHGCALLSAGGVKCWGENEFGQVGDGTTVDRTAPVAVAGLSSGVAAISAGVLHTCALMRDGGVKCWGASGVGQLGDGSKITTTTGPLPHSSTPVAVVGFGPQATATIVSRSAAVTPARVTSLTLRCGAAARCRGTLTLTARSLGKLGAQRFSIPAGSTRTVTVALSTRGFRAVMSARRLAAQARASYEQVPGVSAAATRTVVLAAPATR